MQCCWGHRRGGHLSNGEAQRSSRKDDPNAGSYPWTWSVPAVGRGHIAGLNVSRGPQADGEESLVPGADGLLQTEGALGA